jgi:flavin reductase (DIM6/NTAB) family NADH-FMN oxidoreductase RutF
MLGYDLKPINRYESSAYTDVSSKFGELILADELKTLIPSERAIYMLHPYNSTLVTSRGNDGEPNVLAIAWIIPVSVDPTLIAMSIRPQRHSYHLIKESGEFVVNIPTHELANRVLICGRLSGRKLDKFAKAAFTQGEARNVSAPIIQECVAHIECKIEKSVTLGDHELIVGRVIAAYAKSDYFIRTWDMKKFHPCLHVGMNIFTTCISEQKRQKLPKE